MSNVHALKPSEPPPSDQTAETPTSEAPAVTEAVDDRAELRDALNGEQATCARVDMLLNGIERAEETAAKADAEVEKCEAAVAEAKERDSIAAANAHLKGKAPKGSSTRQARSDLLDAQDDAENARNAVVRLREKLPELQEELKWCQVKVLIARNKLISPLISELTAKVINLQHDLARKLTALSAMCESDEIPELLHGKWQAEKQITAPVADVVKEAKEAIMPSSKAWDYEARSAERQRVLAMLDRLLEDSGAPLPFLGE
ncbi:MAG: hypothetical protein ACLQFW_15975 [Xanthobacteraceae bacterium]